MWRRATSKVRSFFSITRYSAEVINKLVGCSALYWAAVQAPIVLLRVECMSAVRLLAGPVESRMYVRQSDISQGAVLSWP